MGLYAGTRIRHKTFGEGVIAHGPIWAVGQDDHVGHIMSGPEHDQGHWSSEELLYVVEWDKRPAPPLDFEDFSQVGTSVAWLLDGSTLEEIVE